MLKPTPIYQPAEYFLDHGRVFDHRNELQFCATVAAPDINVEYVPEQRRPGHALRLAVGVFAIACGPAAMRQVLAAACSGAITSSRSMFSLRVRYVNLETTIAIERSVATEQTIRLPLET